MKKINIVNKSKTLESVSEEIRQFFKETRQKTGDRVGCDEYGSGIYSDLLITDVSKNLKTITVSNGRQYFLQGSFPMSLNSETEIRWFPEEQMGDHDLIILCNWVSGFDFVHGS